MDETTVIREIGEQLGLGVNATKELLAEYLPQYASLKVSLDIAYIAIVAIIFLIMLVASLVVLRVYMKYKSDDDIPSYEYYRWGTASCILGAIAGFLFAALAIVCIVCVPDAIAWANFPEAQLINEAINAIKG